MEKELWKYLKTAKKPIVLYGMGNGADKIIAVLKQYGISISGVFASDGFVRNKTFHGFQISNYNQLKSQFGDMIVLLCFGSSLPEVITNIKRIAGEQELYAPDVPVIGDGLFTEEHYKNHISEYSHIYSLLADDISKKTFENIINYKLSGKIEYLTECEVTPDEPYKSFLSLEKDTFLDLGAYNGDTVADFIKKCPNYDKIIAVEPDLKTFKKLQKNTESYRNTSLINACVSNTCGFLPFSMKGGRNSVLSNDGQMLRSITVDSLKITPTFIKMDVEGEEQNTIIGASNTILKNKPKMLISAYHRTDDLIKIPQAVLDIRNDYKIYLRHFEYLPAWDTNFYFI